MTAGPESAAPTPSAPDTDPGTVRLVADLPSGEADLLRALADRAGSNRLTTLVRALRLLDAVEPAGAGAAGPPAEDGGPAVGAAPADTEDDGSAADRAEDEDDPVLAALDKVLTAAEQEAVVPDGGWFGDVARSKRDEYDGFLYDLRRELHDLQRLPSVPVAALARLTWWVEGYPDLLADADLRGENVDPDLARPPALPQPPTPPSGPPGPPGPPAEQAPPQEARGSAGAERAGSEGAGSEEPPGPAAAEEPARTEPLRGAFAALVARLGGRRRHGQHRQRPPRADRR